MRILTCDEVRQAAIQVASGPQVSTLLFTQRAGYAAAQFWRSILFGARPLSAEMDFCLLYHKSRQKRHAREDVWLISPLVLSTHCFQLSSPRVAGLLRSLFASQRKAADHARLVAANTRLANIPHRSGSARAALTIYKSGHPAINRKYAGTCTQSLRRSPASPSQIAPIRNAAMRQAKRHTTDQP
jgi:hypothetical protein